MTVGSQVKSCFSSIKSAEATMMSLAAKAQDEHTKQDLITAHKMLADIKTDLQQHILFLTREEPQYKQ